MTDIRVKKNRVKVQDLLKFFFFVFNVKVCNQNSVSLMLAPSASPWVCNYVFHLKFGQLNFFQLYGDNNWSITLCKIKVYNVVIWYMHLLWNDYLSENVNIKIVMVMVNKIILWVDNDKSELKRDTWVAQLLKRLP